MKHRRLLLASVPLLLFCLACGTGGALQEAAFTTTCTESCAAEGADRQQCQTYCECGYAWARDNNRLEELNNTTAPAPGHRMSPVLEDILSACGSDIYDGNFRRECVRACPHGAVCEERCDCMIRELRGPGTREESTRFLIQNLDVDPVTAEGQARIDAAEVVCPP